MLNCSVKKKNGKEIKAGVSDNLASKIYGTLCLKVDLKAKDSPEITEVKNPKCMAAGKRLVQIRRPEKELTLSCHSLTQSTFIHWTAPILQL